MDNKQQKTKEERLLELYIKNYITNTQYFEMAKRIKEGKQKEEALS